MLGTAQAEVLNQTPNDLDAQKVLKLTKGFLKGALHAEGKDDIIQCVRDVKSVLKDADDAYHKFVSLKLR